MAQLGGGIIWGEWIQSPETWEESPMKIKAGANGVQGCKALEERPMEKSGENGIRCPKAVEQRPMEKSGETGIRCPKAVEEHPMKKLG